MPRETRENSVRHEDEIDALFGGAYPNPQRAGCPEREILRAAARKELPIRHDAYEHLARCSECYGEFRAYQPAATRPTWVHAAIAAAIVFAVVTVGSIYAGRSFSVGSWSGAAQSLVLDYRNESVTRSEAGEPVWPVRDLPRKKLDLEILPPIGSEQGTYYLRLVGNAGQVVLTSSTVGELVNFAVRVRTNLDLRSVPRGSYSLELRRAGEEWDPHLVNVR
jgi:hypothetical protein